MKVLRFILVTLILGICFLTACEKFLAPEFISMKDLKFTSFKNNRLNFSISPIIKNPNTFTLWMDGADVDIYFDEEKIGHASSEDKIKLEAEKESEITLNYSVTLDKLKSGPLLLIMKKAVSIKIDGIYTFRNDIKNVTVPYACQTPINFEKELDRLSAGDSTTLHREGVNPKRTNDEFRFSPGR